VHDTNDVPPLPSGKPKWRAGAVAMLVVGLLILIPSGLCTGIFGVGAIYDMVTSSSNEGLSILLEALMFGGIPLAIGGLLVLAAFKMRRSD